MSTRHQAEAPPKICLQYPSHAHGGSRLIPPVPSTCIMSKWKYRPKRNRGFSSWKLPHESCVTGFPLLQTDTNGFLPAADRVGGAGAWSCCPSIVTGLYSLCASPPPTGSPTLYTTCTSDFFSEDTPILNRMPAENMEMNGDAERNGETEVRQ